MPRSPIYSLSEIRESEFLEKQFGSKLHVFTPKSGDKIFLPLTVRDSTWMSALPVPRSGSLTLILLLLIEPPGTSFDWYVQSM